MKKRIVYIAHPISGDIEGNIEKVKAIYKELSLENKVIPFAPYLVAVQALDDGIKEHRTIGFEQNKAFFERGIIDELWVYGRSDGVSIEVEWAIENDIEIVSKIGIRV